MHKVYLKQAWQMLKEDKVIGIITISGTALAITMIMVVILTQEIKTKNITPEIYRERTMYIEYTREESREKSHININPVSGRLYKQYLSQLKTPELLSLQKRDQSRISIINQDEYLNVDILYTDSEFWKMYRFSFEEGKPFSKEDFHSGLPTAVICKSMAQKLFKGESPLGKEFLYKNKQHRICGVVKDISTLCDKAYSQIWIPYTSVFEKMEDGHFTVVILAGNKNDFNNIKKEVRESEIRNLREIDKNTVQFIGPYSRRELLVKEGNLTNEDPNLKKSAFRFYLILAILLLIPAVNLSGFSLFRIINRTSEIGIRKAFGANRKTILTQVLYENLLTSLTGGIIGLLLSYFTVTLIKDRLFTIENNSFGEVTIPISSFISPSIFFYVFLICLILNLLSSGIPAWRASRLHTADAIKS
ncbi:MAG: FtsX-like permease family protein [Dysgonamonadaceae bacterium]|jgi:putative ABC transport system permease protein|nr:FtsX-like permease family protein [Dysgonamonadaceae bacterium]